MAPTSGLAAVQAGALPPSDAGKLDSATRTTGFVTRNELFAAVALIGFANGISGKVATSVLGNGLTAALLSTFQISIIVWASLAISIRLLLQADPRAPERSDWIVATGALLAFVVPMVEMSWVIISGLAIYLLITSRHSNTLMRGAWILLALAFPMFWSRLLFYMMSNLILEGDAALVGWLVGTERVGNAIELSDGSGYLWIAPGCSSLANVSLVVLCWVTLSRLRDRSSSTFDLLWILAACAAVVLVNVSRMSLIGLYPEHYDVLHGSVGAGIANWLILGVTVGICHLGVGHDRNKTRL